MEKLTDNHEVQVTYGDGKNAHIATVGELKERWREETEEWRENFFHDLETKGIAYSRVGTCVLSGVIRGELLKTGTVVHTSNINGQDIVTRVEVDGKVFVPAGMDDVNEAKAVLKRAGYIQHYWHEDDIRSVIADNSIQATDDIVSDVKDKLEDIDCNIGINWDTIQMALDSVMQPEEDDDE